MTQGPRGFKLVVGRQQACHPQPRTDRVQGYQPLSLPRVPSVSRGNRPRSFGFAAAQDGPTWLSRACLSWGRRRPHQQSARWITHAFQEYFILEPAFGSSNRSCNKFQQPPGRAQPPSGDPPTPSMPSSPAAPAPRAARRPVGWVSNQQAAASTHHPSDSTA